MKILIVEPGTIKPETLKILEEKGVIVIECNNPENVKTFNFESKIFTHDLLMSAMHAVESASGSNYFVKELNRRLLAKEKEKQK